MEGRTQSITTETFPRKTITQPMAQCCWRCGASPIEPRKMEPFSRPCGVRQGWLHKEGHGKKAVTRTANPDHVGFIS